MFRIFLKSIKKSIFFVSLYKFASKGDRMEDCRFRILESGRRNLTGLMRMQMHQFCSLNFFFFFFALSRNFSLEEGKSAEKMEETNQPSDVRGMEDWCRSVDRKSSIRWTHNELTVQLQLGGTESFCHADFCYCRLRYASKLTAKI